MFEVEWSIRTKSELLNWKEGIEDRIYVMFQCIKPLQWIRTYYQAPPVSVWWLRQVNIICMWAPCVWCHLLHCHLCVKCKCFHLVCLTEWLQTILMVTTLGKQKYKSWQEAKIKRKWRCVAFYTCRLKC